MVVRPARRPGPGRHGRFGPSPLAAAEDRGVRVSDDTDDIYAELDVRRHQRPVMIRATGYTVAAVLQWIFILVGRPTPPATRPALPATC